MLRVGLTGGLGSGKSKAGRMFAERGAILLQSDEMARELMQPGQDVHAQIAAHFGPAALLSDGTLNRPALARLAFEEGGEAALSAIVHPAVIAEQARRLAALPPDAIAVIESALIFETRYAGPEGWRSRFDRLILVTAPEALKIARFLTRSHATAETAPSLEAEARRRLALQLPDADKIAYCNYVIDNSGDETLLASQVNAIWSHLTDGLRTEFRFRQR